MTAHSTLYVGNTMVLELDALATAAGTLQATATVTLESMVDEDGESVSGVSYPLTMAYAGASPIDGRYTATLPDDLGVVAERWYTATIKAVSAAGAVLLVTERIRATVLRA